MPPGRFVLPSIPTSVQLQEAIRRMSPAEAQQAFRHRVLPISWEPGRTSYVAAGERGKAYAAEQGFTVSAVTHERTMLRELQAGQESELTNHAVGGLKNRFPHYSSAQPFSAQQALWLVFGLAFIAFAVMWDRQPSEVAAFGLVLALFGLNIGVKIWCLLPVKLPQAPPANVVADDELPVYSVLVPLLRETKVADQTVRAMQALDYPKARLDIKFILEADDQATCKFFDDLRLPSHAEVIVVPKSQPQTKFKALNYALAFARGDLVAVYDADSVPAPDQLRRIAASFALAPKTVACLQTQLGFYNRNENWLTRQGALELAFRFKLLFPRLARFGAPLLFAGTSTHYRMTLLRQAGGFDPHNLASNSGLGIRLARSGLRTALIPVATREEAASRLKDWLPQRTRWIRGALQTAVVHARSPVKMWRELGGRNFLLTQALSAGAIIVALLHPVFLIWMGTVATLTALGIPAVGQLWLFLLAIYALVAMTAYLVAIICAIRASLYLGRGAWIAAIITLPIYWLLVSLASWLAVLQFFSGSYRWAKTAHGLSRIKPQIGPVPPKPAAPDRSSDAQNKDQPRPTNGI